MWVISDAAKAALNKQVQTYISKCDVISSSGALLKTLDVTSGDIAVDGTASIRRSLAIKLTDPSGTLVPRTAKDLLDPRTGNELRVFRGIVLGTKYATMEAAVPSQNIEWVPLITARLTNPNITENASGLEISITGYDRARAVQRVQWVDRYFVPYNTTVPAAIRALLLNRVSTLSIITAASAQLIYGKWFGLDGQSDPWKDAMSLAELAGWKLRVDPMGVVYAGPIPDPNLQIADWSYVEGTDCMVTDYSRDLSEDQTYSGVIITAESIAAGTSFQGVAWDTDINSPTYYLGPFGKIPFRKTITGIGTQIDADAAAAAELIKVKGLSEKVSITAVPNPALDADDVIRVTRSRLGIDAYYVVESITQPIGDGLMKIVCKTRRI